MTRKQIKKVLKYGKWACVACLFAGCAANLVLGNYFEASLLSMATTVAIWMD